MPNRTETDKFGCYSENVLPELRYVVTTKPATVPLRRLHDSEFGNGRSLLAGLLLVLLTGLPQIGIGLTTFAETGERIGGSPSVRTVLRDKLLPKVGSFKPPPLLHLDIARSTRIDAGPVVLGDTEARLAKPGQWLTNLTHNLYRQRSNYV